MTRKARRFSGRFLAFPAKRWLPCAGGAFEGGKNLLASGACLCYNEKKNPKETTMDTLLLEACRFVVVFFLFAVAGWCV